MQVESCKLKAPVPDSIPGLKLAPFPIFCARHPIKAHAFHPPTTRSSLPLPKQGLPQGAGGRPASLGPTPQTWIPNLEPGPAPRLAAHDLRNPLTSILLYCEMMSEDPPTPKVGNQVGAIKALGSNMADLIKRLLDIHAIEAGLA